MPFSLAILAPVSLFQVPVFSCISLKVKKKLVLSFAILCYAYFVLLWLSPSFEV